MKITKEEFVIAYEDYIEMLVLEQAKLVIEIENLVKELRRHQRDCLLFNLRYEVDDETGLYTYEKIQPKKIGFVTEPKPQKEITLKELEDLCGDESL